MTGPGSQLASGRAGVPTQDRPAPNPSPSPEAPVHALLFPLGLPPPPPALAPAPVASLHSLHQNQWLGSQRHVASQLPERRPKPISASGATVTAHTGSLSPSETTNDTSQGETSSCLNPFVFGRCSASYFKGNFVPVLLFLPSLRPKSVWATVTVTLRKAPLRPKCCAEARQQPRAVKSCGCSEGPLKAIQSNPLWCPLSMGPQGDLQPRLAYLP